LKANETDPDNLMYLFDILLNFVCIRVNPPRKLPFSLTRTNYNLFLCGESALAVSLLKQLKISIFYYLFQNMKGDSFQNVRLVLLIIINQICNPAEQDFDKNLEEIHGTGFFQNLVDDTNPYIAYHASKWLSSYFSAKQPDTYEMALRKFMEILPIDKSANDFFHVLAFSKKLPEKL